jgi:hypothetical protein
MALVLLVTANKNTAIYLGVFVLFGYISNILLMYSTTTGVDP